MTNYVYTLLNRVSLCFTFLHCVALCNTVFILFSFLPHRFVLVYFASCICFSCISQTMCHFLMKQVGLSRAAFMINYWRFLWNFQIKNPFKDFKNFTPSSIYFDLKMQFWGKSELNLFWYTELNMLMNSNIGNNNATFWPYLAS